ncbi:MAG TPA: hypothetical protein VLL25_00750 [Acidimicrobiales bacterium]|nr:hypothetical protein [Acidimicrobiales bacterium]
MAPPPGRRLLVGHGKIPADLLDALADWQVQFDTDFHYETGWISEDPRRRMGTTRRRTRSRAPPGVTPDHPPHVDLWPVAPPRRRRWFKR